MTNPRDALREALIEAERLDRAGDARGAIAALSRAVELRPDLAPAHARLGILLQEMGQVPHAIDHLRVATRLAPGDAAAWNNLAAALLEIGDLAGCESAARRAVESDPSHLLAWELLGESLLRQARLGRAQAALSEAVRIDPGRASAWARLGSALLHSGRIPEALEAMARGESLAPPDAAQIGSSRLLAMHYDPRHDRSSIFEAHQAWAARYEPAPMIEPFRNARGLQRPLRVAYVSPRFHDSTLMRLLEPVLRHHDPRAVEVWCYAVTPIENEIIRGARSLAARWVDASALDDRSLALRMRDDAIDIAVDLAGHAPGNRLRAFAQRPAPVCMSWLDYFDTTGIAAMDFLVTDKWHSPEDGGQRFTEEPLRLSRVRFCYEPPAEAPEVVTPAAGRIPVLASFNRGAKLSAETLDAWRLALDAVPGARLLIKNSSLDHAEERDAFSRRIAAAGVDPSRVELRGFSEYAQMLDQYNGVDVVLDTFPYNGGVTTLEALWMGRPVVTIRGDTMVSRQGVALLSAVGLEDLVASDAHAFARIVAAIAYDTPRRASLALELRDRMRRSPLLDAPGMARALEAAYHVAWRRFVA